MFNSLIFSCRNSKHLCFPSLWQEQLYNWCYHWGYRYETVANTQIHIHLYMFINQHKIDIMSIPSLFSLIITNICIFFCRWSFYVKQSEESESKLIKKTSSLWYKYKVIEICKQWHNRWINWSQWFLVIIEIWYEDICVSVMASLAGDGPGQEWC